MAKNKRIEQTAVEPVKLICGFLYRHRDLFESVLVKLEGIFGPVELESETFDFSHTNYYTAEMGNDLKRCFLSFEKPVYPDRLREIKKTTNDLEAKYPNDTGGRTVNIDPGLVSLANLVLASTKEFSHRLYLGDGIYGEVSMIYENRTFTPLKWTYPDYQHEKVIDFLIRVRESLKEDIIALRQKD